jgi:hypothetical protein
MVRFPKKEAQIAELAERLYRGLLDNKQDNGVGGWVFLDWKAPVDGGKVSTYKVQRRNRPEGVWQEVGTAIETESTLVGQPKGAELEYCIIAINKAGEGPASNVSMVIL